MATTHIEATREHTPASLVITSYCGRIVEEHRPLPGQTVLAASSVAGERVTYLPFTRYTRNPVANDARNICRTCIRVAHLE